MSALTDLMAEDLGTGRPPDGTDQLVDAIVERHGASVLAILLYGSCRRMNDASEGLVDLLVVVDRYRPALGSSIGALFNTILPPNVYYLQIEQNQRTLRCKYAVVSLGQFRRRARSRSDHYFWARFCQPARLAHGDAQICQQLAAIRARASIEFSRRIAPMITGTVSSESFWIQALQTTYRCELRPEPPDNARRLIQHDPEYWTTLSGLLADLPDSRIQSADGRLSTSATPVQRVLGRLSWGLRRPWGKLFNLARLLKAAGTFSNGIDYIAWKVERHSGVRIEPTERMRRYPRLAAWGLVWKMWRQGGFR